MATSRTKKSSGLQPIEGKDGRLYFNYGVSAVYALFSKSGQEIGRVKITGCYYDERRGELYEIETHGEKKNIFTGRPVPLDRLVAHFSYCRAQEIEAGVSEELPLLQEEVTAYYKGKESERKRAAAEARVKLIETYPSYALNKKAKKATEAGLADAETSGDHKRVAELIREYMRILTERKKACERAGIDVRVFEPVSRCAFCGGSGIMENGTICICAIEQVDEIKRWNAAKRIKERMSKEWALYVRDNGQRKPAMAVLEEKTAERLVDES